MNQKEILQWAIYGTKAAWQKQNEREKACKYPKARAALKQSQANMMQKMIELNQMLEELKEEEQ